ncbi:MAG TPA: toll/interleukin-1 receptor domain-containing protein [Thermoanaerobaculia bacterium]|nr:toll/interleukin-1 receptor domain-containing protein [Thermoanaerobaculia bacterium]
MEPFQLQPVQGPGPLPCPAAGDAPGPSSSPLDVFLSYGHEDYEWVHENLLTSLRDAGVTVYIDDDFEIGKFSLKAMEDAVARCRHTLLVLTPAWCASPWANFEMILAATPSPLGGRVLPLLLETCELSPMLAALVYVDFRLLRRRKEEFAKLLRAIAATAPAPKPVQGEPVRRGLVALTELILEPEVRDAVVAFRLHFQRVCGRIGIFGAYKKIHDQLHTLQLHCYDRIVQEAKRFPGDDLAVRNLRDHETTLRGTITELRHIEQRVSFPAGELSWIPQYLEPALEALHTALETREPKGLGRTRSLLNRVLTLRPSEINTRLNDMARDLPLSGLIDAMTVVRDRMSSLELDPEKVRRFESGIETLDRLRETLDFLVAEHDRWQEAEQELRLTEETWDGTIEGITDSWSKIRETIEPMTANNTELWAVPLRQEAERLTRAVETQDPEEAETCFRSFRREAAARFHQVDVMLKDQCDELHEVDEPLAFLLERIKS